MIAVLVLGDVETFDRAVMRARRDHRDFALERHEGFEDAGLAADVAPGRRRIGAVLDRGLALAVIAEAARLQDRRPADALDRGRERLGRADIGKRGGADAEPVDELLFHEPVLRRRQHLRIGQHRNARGEKGRGLRRHVLEFVSDDVDVAGKAVERFGVGVVGGGDAMHDVEGGRVGRRRKDVALEAEPRRGQRQHAAELAAAEDPDRGLGLQHRRRFAHAPSFGCSATPSVWRCRQASSRLPSVGSPSASTLAASSAALTAPAGPIASVPTGTPGGICTME